MFVATVGSREITAGLQKSFINLGAAIVNKGHQIKTGNAPGSDQAYAMGGNIIDVRQVYLYLPWYKFEEQALVPGNNIFSSQSQEDIELAKEAAPYWSTLSIGRKKLLARNVKIVRNAELVLAYINHRNLGGGGTGHAVRVASILKIETMDISYPDVLQSVEKMFDVESVAERVAARCGECG